MKINWFIDNNLAPFTLKIASIFEPFWFVLNYGVQKIKKEILWYYMNIKLS